LSILLERPGQVVTRDELHKRLWPDTFVDVDHNLNTAINKIREVLGDSGESPRFVETLPRRGYRFIAPVDGIADPANIIRPSPEGIEDRKHTRIFPGARVLSLVSVLVLGAAAFLIYRRPPGQLGRQHALTRITFDEGLQIGVTWSPDSRFIAYSSDRGGKFDIRVQPVSGDPAQSLGLLSTI
jgi:DNA-binding winged helix-turn-helix (wHTH) protein